MGYFRRYKLSDYTADECKKNILRIELNLLRENYFERNQIVAQLEKWACFRELLARHEGKNESSLDTTRYIVTKSTRNSNRTYTGPTWNKAKIVHLMQETWTDRHQAQKVAKILTEHNPVGFIVKKLR